MNSKCLLYNKVKKKNPALWICMSLNKHKYTLQISGLCMKRTFDLTPEK